MTATNPRPEPQSSDVGQHQQSPRPGTVGEVFVAFAIRGLTSFGGPIAHLGYFRETFVVRRKWLTETDYADLVALCQFLPGPASSQVGMALGLIRAGYRGLLAAWLAFTLPSALLLVGFAAGVQALGFGADTGWLQGLKAAAVAVVANAVLGMARTLTPDRKRATIAGAAAITILLIPAAWAQLAVIAGTGLIGVLWLRPPDSTEASTSELSVPVRRGVAVGCLIGFAALLAALPAAAALANSSALSLVDGFYRSGALVFGGGHVVLPLLDQTFVAPGLVDHDAFLAGYGAAQAVPGPLFTFSAYLGYVATTPPHGLVGATLALLAIFLPSALLIIGGLPFWQQLRHNPQARTLLMGINAGVVGILTAALYNPVFTQGITTTPALAIAIAAFIALSAWKTPAWAVVIAAALLGTLLL